MLIFGSAGNFRMTSYTISHRTLSFSTAGYRGYHGQKNIEIVFRNTLFIETAMNHLNLRIETVKDDAEINYLKGNMLIYAGDPKLGGNTLDDKRKRLDNLLKSLSIKYYRLVSLDFSGFICCAAIDVFEDGVKLLGTWGVQE